MSRLERWTFGMEAWMDFISTAISLASLFLGALVMLGGAFVGILTLLNWIGW